MQEAEGNLGRGGGGGGVEVEIDERDDAGSRGIAASNRSIAAVAASTSSTSEA